MSWPRLSETLPFERSPEVCSACGARWVELARYFECDDAEKPTPVVLMFCKRCERDVMEPHPRAYLKFDENRHFPGALDLCSPCQNREGLGCKLAKYNGGPGVHFAPPPERMHLQRVPRSQSGWYTFWEPARECTGRQVLPLVSAEE